MILKNKSITRIENYGLFVNLNDGKNDKLMCLIHKKTISHFYESNFKIGDKINIRILTNNYNKISGEIVNETNLNSLEDNDYNDYNNINSNNLEIKRNNNLYHNEINKKIDNLNKVIDYNEDFPNIYILDNKKIVSDINIKKKETKELELEIENEAGKEIEKQIKELKINPWTKNLDSVKKPLIVQNIKKKVVKCSDSGLFCNEENIFKCCESLDSDIYYFKKIKHIINYNIKFNTNLKILSSSNELLNLDTFNENKTIYEYIDNEYIDNQQLDNEELDNIVLTNNYV
jgi:predicted RNA-binding protein with RPS1 domain